MADIYFDDYMRHKLYGSRGYYKSSFSVKEKNDFITSPNISNFFGNVIGKFIAEKINKRFNNEKFNIIEIGSNDGTLSLHILDYLSKFKKKIYQKTHYFIVEQNSNIKKKINKNLYKHKNKFTFYTKLEELKSDNKNSFIFCNELFDSLPFHRCIFREEKLYEILISKNHSKYIESEVEARTKLKEKIISLNMDIESNLFFEFPSYEFFEIVRSINNINNNILFLSFDYGDKKNILGSSKYPKGTARTFHNNKVGDNFYNNDVDITYSINFELLSREFISYGFNEELFETQTKFLIDNSFLEIIHDSINSSSLDTTKLKNLISPAFMGEAFKVVFFSKII